MTRKIVYLFSIILFATFVNAYTPTWKVDFINILSSYLDGFTAGTGSSATDGYDPFADILHPPPPLSGAYIQMRTLVDGQILTVDYRSDLLSNIPKTWNITLIAYDPLFIGLSGTNTLTWSHNVPNGIYLTLIDYGTDSTRTNKINEINMKEESSYNFAVSNGLGPYRYLNLRAELLNSFNISLTKGWNLVSIPLNLTNNSVDALFNGLSIYGYKNNSWFAPDKIDNKFGYWIKVNENKNITIVGTEIENKTINLDGRWNLISYPHLNEIDVNNSNLKNYTAFAYINSTWLSYVPNRTFNSLQTLKPGYGYWIKIK